MNSFTKYIRDMTLLVRLSQYRQIPARVMNDATSTGGWRNSPYGQRHAFLSPDFVMSLMTHTPRGTFLGKILQIFQWVLPRHLITASEYIQYV